MSRGWFAGGRGESPLTLETIEEIATLETLTPGRSRLADGLPYVMAGAALVVGVAVIGSYLGNVASARTGPGTEWNDVTQPASVSLVQKASLTQGDIALEEQGYSVEIGQQVTASLKSDLILDSALERDDSIVLRPAVLPLNKPQLLSPHRQSYAVASPPARKLNAIFKRGHTARGLAQARRQAKIAQHHCLAKAIYFEARSESKAGQLAVANVVMNRVKSSNYPNNICAVVYENHSKTKLHGCQFSFTCDGQHDRPKLGKQWDFAKKLAHKVMNKSEKSRVVNASVLHYHADYVKPKWSRFMRRLTKIGRHIFYTGS